MCVLACLDPCDRCQAKRYWTFWRTFQLRVWLQRFASGNHVTCGICAPMRCPWEEIHRKQNYPCSNGKGKCPLWCAPQLGLAVLVNDRHDKFESHRVNSGTAKGCERCFEIPGLSFCAMSSQVTAWTQWYQRRGRTHGESPGGFKVFWTERQTMTLCFMSLMFSKTIKLDHMIVLRTTSLQCASLWASQWPWWTKQT